MLIIRATAPYTGVCRLVCKRWRRITDPVFSDRPAKKRKKTIANTLRPVINDCIENKYDQLLLWFLRSGCLVPRRALLHLVRQGHGELVEELPVDKAIIAALKGGHLDIVYELLSRLKEHPSFSTWLGQARLLSVAIKFRQLDLIQELLKYHPITDNLLKDLIRRGYYDLAWSLYIQQGHTASSSYGVSHALGRAGCMTWPLRVIDRTWFVEGAVSACKIEVLEWLGQHVKYRQLEVCALEHAQVEVLKWVQQRDRSNLSTESVETVIRTNKRWVTEERVLTTLVYLDSLGISMPEKTSDRFMLTRGYTQVLDWLKGKGISITYPSNNLPKESYRWLLKNGIVSPDLLHHHDLELFKLRLALDPPIDLARAFHAASVEVLDYLFSLGVEPTQYNLDEALDSEKLLSIKWLLDHGIDLSDVTVTVTCQRSEDLLVLLHHYGAPWPSMNWQQYTAFQVEHCFPGVSGTVEGYQHRRYRGIPCCEKAVYTAKIEEEK